MGLRICEGKLDFLRFEVPVRSSEDWPRGSTHRAANMAKRVCALALPERLRSLPRLVSGEDAETEGTE